MNLNTRKNKSVELTKFAYINNYFIDFMHDDRCFQEILSSFHNVDKQTEESVIMGIVFSDRVCIFKGYDYSPVPIREFPNNLFDDMNNILHYYLGHENCVLINGYETGEDKLHNVIASYQGNDINF
jgi:hypothetical protein